MQASKDRVVELDGIRGIAALWVVFSHLWGAIQKRDTGWVPAYIGDFFEAGFLGVDMFFVLSGFVITYSLSKIKLSASFVPKFMLRRSIRLDPPYWFAIAIAVTFIFLKAVFFPSVSEKTVSIETVLIHLLYLQDLFAYPNISSVFWTLCLEFQFYLIFSIGYYFFSKYGDSTKHRLYIIFLVLGYASIALSPSMRFSSFDFMIPGTLLPYSYEFVLGIMAFQYVKGRLSAPLMILAIILTVITTMMYRPVYYALAPIFTVAVAIIASKGIHINILRSYAVLYLGKVSYSLYLTHAVVGWGTISLLCYIFEKYSGSLVTLLIFSIGLSFSLIFSIVFYKIVEKPSILLSKKLLTLSSSNKRSTTYFESS